MRGGTKSVVRAGERCEGGVRGGTKSVARAGVRCESRLRSR